MTADTPLCDYALADLTALDPAQKGLWSSLSAADDAQPVGGVEALALVALRSSDFAAFGDLLRGGAASLISSRQHPEVLARDLGQRHYYFHPGTGRLLSYAICVPVIMAFFLANATPALAQHLTERVERIVAKGYAGVYVEAQRDTLGIEIRLAQPMAAAQWDQEIVLASEHAEQSVEAVRDSQWVLRSCPLIDTTEAEAAYGSFPELTPEFIAAFERFQRRLCLRRLAEAEKAYLERPFDASLEARLLSKAKSCGYWDDLSFSSFAYSYLILGEADLSENQNFVCDPDTHPGRALFNLELPRKDADFRKRNIDRFGAKDSILE